MNKRNTQRLQGIQGIHSMHLPAPMANQQRKGAHIVIIGNGIAGLTAAVAARRAAPHKGIIMVTEQSHPTINTPALKQFAVGKLEREQLLAYPLGTERNNTIQVVHGRVEEIHARERYIRLSHGGILDYGDLLLATGSTANGLPQLQCPHRHLRSVWPGCPGCQRLCRTPHGSHHVPPSRG
ncbi:MAG TPA: FAD/NAD(P)-binding oxidoreductase [Ktedonobacteraceae bacterium]|nr:FAD/NAD(P)-binding oxidoreductase [Ktedonobacteraceae bacterium]